MSEAPVTFHVAFAPSRTFCPGEAAETARSAEYIVLILRMLPVNCAPSPVMSMFTVPPLLRIALCACEPLPLSVRLNVPPRW